MAVDFKRTALSVDQAQPKEMGDAKPMHQALTRVCWILVRPSHPGNIGAAARALKATGFNRLALANLEPEVSQRLLADPQASAMASGADDLLADCQADELAAILAPTAVQLALTARPREFEPQRRSLDEALEEISERLASSPEEQVAIVLGSERSGLSNEELLRCNRVCGLDVNPLFGSLNLAQALQIVAYLLRHEIRKRGDHPLPTPQTPGLGRPKAFPATSEAVEALHLAFMETARSADYLDAENPGRFNERLRSLWARAELRHDEVQMLQGLLAAIRKKTKSFSV